MTKMNVIFLIENLVQGSFKAKIVQKRLYYSNKYIFLV
jgi:hypothetical protein